MTQLIQTSMTRLILLSWKKTIIMVTLRIFREDQQVCYERAMSCRHCVLFTITSLFISSLLRFQQISSEEMNEYTGNSDTSGTKFKKKTIENKIKEILGSLISLSAWHIVRIFNSTIRNISIITHRRLDDIANRSFHYKILVFAFFDDHFYGVRWNVREISTYLCANVWLIVVNSRAIWRFKVYNGRRKKSVEWTSLFLSPGSEE